jgi:hypothetical protein
MPIFNLRVVRTVSGGHHGDIAVLTPGRGLRPGFWSQTPARFAHIGCGFFGGLHILEVEVAEGYAAAARLLAAAFCDVDPAIERTLSVGTVVGSLWL